MDNIEERLGRLEENGYFLEERLKALDSQIAAQQADLETLAKKVEQLQIVLRDLRDAISASGLGRSANELPPHHIARFW